MCHQCRVAIFDDHSVMKLAIIQASVLPDERRAREEVVISSTMKGMLFEFIIHNYNILFLLNKSYILCVYLSTIFRVIQETH